MVEIIAELLLQLFIEPSDSRYVRWLENILGATVDVGLYLITVLGAASLQLFALSKGGDSAQSFLRKHFPTRSDGFYVWTDLAIVVFFGAYIGKLVFDPETARQAFGAGLGWVGAVTALAEKTVTPVADVQPPEEPSHD